MELEQVVNQNSKDTKLNLNISGMTCSNCAMKISNSLAEIPGVKKADVILSTENAVVEFEKDKVSINSIISKINEIGYKGMLSKVIISLNREYSDQEIVKIKTDLMDLVGIEQVLHQEKDNSLKVNFNSAQISENQLIRHFKKLGYEGSKSQGILEQEKEIYKKDIIQKRNLLIWSLIFTIPIVILSQLKMNTEIFTNNEDMVNLILFLLTTAEQIIVGSFFYQNAYKSLKSRSANMDVLISIGSATAYIYSIFTTFNIINGGEFYDASVMIFTFIIAGKLLESVAKGKTSTSLTKLMELKSSTATVLIDGKEIHIDVDEIDVGQVIVIKPGEKVPIDGRIIEGITRIDESMLTGESYTVKKQKGDIIIGGTINQNGSIKAEVEKIGNDTMLNRIIELVRNAQTDKAPLQRIADRVSEIFVPVVISIATLAFLYWYYIEAFAFENALLRFVSIVVISCPCAMGLAIPTAVMVGTGIGAKSGILIKGGASLEAVHKVKHLVFDKTGTLTIGKPVVIDIIPLNNASKEDIIQITASIESYSEHPISKAILSEAEKLNLELYSVNEFKNIPGFGISGYINNEKITLGKPDFIEVDNVGLKDLDSETQKKVKELQRKAKTVIILWKADAPIGIISVADKIKPYTKDVISKIKDLGITPYILTGDNDITAKAIADQIGIEQYYAEILPSNKLQIISYLQDTNESLVAMVGDGINDAPALTKADVGIAIGSGTDIAIESADIVLIRGDLRNLVAAIMLSKKTYNKMIQNLFWAFIYNIIGIPFAAGLFYGLLGFFLPPGIASLFMAFSSVSVVISALLLYRINLVKFIENFESAEVLKVNQEPSESMELETEDISTESLSELNAPIYLCENCGETMDIPKHCGRNMIPSDGKLVCWMNLPKKEGGMGIQCGETEIPKHCGKKMTLIENMEDFKLSKGKVSKMKKDINQTELEEKNMSGKLKCKTCKETLPIPKHCGRDMILRDGKLICWMNLPKEEGGMGIQCEETEIPQHCGHQMELV